MSDETKPLDFGDLVRRHDDDQVMRIVQFGGGKNARQACCHYVAENGFNRGQDGYAWVPVGDLVAAAIPNHLADEVASVLVQLDEVWADTGAKDDETIRRCRDRLRAALKQAKGE